MTRLSVSKWVAKALAVGPMAALKDSYHRPKEPAIGDDAKAWVVHVACSKPKDLGYAAEVWSRQALARHIREHAVEAGFPALSRAAKATVHRILAEQPLHPEKVKYYLERRDPEFDAKMRRVLIVYQDVALQNAKRTAGETASTVITVSVDEKPGVQAIGNTAPDLPPVPGKHPKIGRDHEYERFGTCSILAALDLQDGHVTARVEDRHRSVEFIGLLSDLDAKYPPECTIRIILDNHSAHISKETQEYLSKHPNRFQYVLTPKHGSWLGYSFLPQGPDSIFYVYHPIRDDEDLPNLAEIEALGRLVADLVSAGHRVLVHCRMGLNRSALVIATALTYMGLSGREAVADLRRRRPGSLFNEVFAAHIEALPPRRLSIETL